MATLLNGNLDGQLPGGMNTGLIPLAGIRGGSWTQNGYRIEGINVSDSFNTGRPMVYPDLGSLQEFQVSKDSDFSEVLGAGSTFGLISRQGGSTLHGEAQGYYLGKPFQSSKQNGRSNNLGITNTLQFKHFGEGQFSLGGHISRLDKWTFFTSLGFQHPSRSVTRVGPPSPVARSSAQGWTLGAGQRPAPQTCCADVPVCSPAARTAQKGAPDGTFKDPI